MDKEIEQRFESVENKNDQLSLENRELDIRVTKLEKLENKE